jgi:hypothetical protein
VVDDAPGSPDAAGSSLDAGLGHPSTAAGLDGRRWGFADVLGNLCVGFGAHGRIMCRDGYRGSLRGGDDGGADGPASSSGGGEVRVQGLTWANLVGRDGIEPPTLRFSAGCGSSGSVRHGSAESHPPWSVRL